MTLRALFNLRDKNKKTAIDYIINNEKLVDLYKNYQLIKTGDKERFQHYVTTIKNDLPRTFPCCDYVKKHEKKIKELLYTFCLYSSIGYIQGQNFLASACVHFFGGRTPYMSFYLFVALFDNVKDIFLLQIDQNFAKKNLTFNTAVEECTDIFLNFYKKEHPEHDISETTMLVLKNFVQWRLFGTLLMSIQNDIENTQHIITYFLPFLYDRKMFETKLRALSLSFLFCCLFEKELTEEVILQVQNASMSEEALIKIIDCSKDTIKLLNK